MHNSILLTCLMLVSLILPDIISVMTSQFATVDAELKYYKYFGEDLLKYRSQLIENIKMRYLDLF